MGTGFAPGRCFVVLKGTIQIINEGMPYTDTVVENIVTNLSTRMDDANATSVGLAIEHFLQSISPIKKPYDYWKSIGAKELTQFIWNMDCKGVVFLDMASGYKMSELSVPLEYGSRVIVDGNKSLSLHVALTVKAISGLESSFSSKDLDNKEFKKVIYRKENMAKIHGYTKID